MGYSWPGMGFHPVIQNPKDVRTACSCASSKTRSAPVGRAYRRHYGVRPPPKAERYVFTPPSGTLWSAAIHCRFRFSDPGLQAFGHAQKGHPLRAMDRSVAVH